MRYFVVTDDYILEVVVWYFVVTDDYIEWSKTRDDCK